MAAIEERGLMIAELAVVGIAAGVAGWLLLVLRAGLAMGSAPRVDIAIALTLAGLAAAIDLAFGALALLSRREVSNDQEDSAHRHHTSTP